MIIDALCMPAMIYCIYAISHVMIDLYRGMYNTACVELLVGILFTLLLNMLCDKGLNVVSWLIISIPFLLMTTIAMILLFAFGLNPATGKALYSTTPPPQPNQPTLTPVPLPPTKPVPSETNTTSKPSPYSMPLTVRVESFMARPKPSDS